MEADPKTQMSSVSGNERGSSLSRSLARSLARNIQNKPKVIYKNTMPNKILPLPPSLMLH